MLTERVNLIAEGLRRNPHMVLESYPNECWMFDHCVALAAISTGRPVGRHRSFGLDSRLACDGERKAVHPNPVCWCPALPRLVGRLMVPKVPHLGGLPFLQFLDADFARAQYELARRQLEKSLSALATHTNGPATWPGPADIDSGPIIPVLDISAGFERDGVCRREHVSG